MVQTRQQAKAANGINGTNGGEDKQIKTPAPKPQLDNTKNINKKRARGVSESASQPAKVKRTKTQRVVEDAPATQVPVESAGDKPTSTRENQNKTSDTPEPGNSSKKGFLKLPAELRNEIYTQAAEDFAKENVYKVGSRPPLLFVNKQIRQEFMSIYYTPEIFDLDYWHPWDRKWLRLFHPKGIKILVETRAVWEVVGASKGEPRHDTSGFCFLQGGSNSGFGPINLSMLEGNSVMFYSVPYTQICKAMSHDGVR